MWAFLAVGAAITALSIVPARAETFAERTAVCLSCHGEKGQSETQDVPSLGGQPSPAVLIQLYLFREKRRTNEIMNEMAKDMTDADLQAFSDFIAGLPPPPPPQATADPARMAAAQALAAANHCNSCHNPDFSGRDNIPRLRNQREEYLLKSLREYKSGVRGGYDAAMAEVVAPLADPQLVELAYFLSNVR